MRRWLTVVALAINFAAALCLVYAIDIGPAGLAGVAESGAFVVGPMPASEGKPLAVIKSDRPALLRWGLWGMVLGFVLQLGLEVAPGRKR